MSIAQQPDLPRHAPEGEPLPTAGHDATSHDAAHGRDQHGNPLDFERYVRRLEDPERLAWQQPDEVIARLGLGPGAVVIEVGPGAGVWTRRLAAVVGETGRVYAVEVEPRLLALVRDRLEQAGLGQVTPVLGLAGDPLLPPGSADLALLVTSYHHIADGGDYLARLRRCLRPGGRVAIIDFHRREQPVGPPPEHLVDRQTVIEAAEAAGLRLLAEHDFLPYHYFLIFG